MRLLIDQTLVTAPLAAALAAGWIEPSPDVSVELATGLSSSSVGEDDAALVPASEIAHLQPTHLIVPDVAVVAPGLGPVSLRTAVRPDEVERTPVRLAGTSGVAELLARATLQPYFGIQAATWTRDEDVAAEAVVLEGADALRPIEGGFAEDLCRAWFILTGLPVVTHVLITPQEMSRAEVQSVLQTLRLSAEVGHERRREWRTELIDRLELDRERVLALYASLQYALTPEDRPAVTALLQRGGRGSSYPPASSIRFLEAEATD